MSTEERSEDMHQNSNYHDEVWADDNGLSEGNAFKSNADSNDGHAESLPHSSANPEQGDGRGGNQHLFGSVQENTNTNNSNPPSYAASIDIPHASNNPIEEQKISHSSNYQPTTASFAANAMPHHQHGGNFGVANMGNYGYGGNYSSGLASGYPMLTNSYLNSSLLMGPPLGGNSDLQSNNNQIQSFSSVWPTAHDSVMNNTLAPAHSAAAVPPYQNSVPLNRQNNSTYDQAPTTNPGLGPQDWTISSIQHPSTSLNNSTLGIHPSTYYTDSSSYNSDLAASSNVDLAPSLSQLTTSRASSSLANFSQQQDSSASSSLLQDQSLTMTGQQNMLNIQHATRLAIPTDSTFLDPVHIFLRQYCIEVFVSTRQDVTCPGKGSRAATVGQVGLRCAFCKDLPRHQLARQALCYPSKRETIFESVRNYQRVHFQLCPNISDDMKAEYKKLAGADFVTVARKSQRFIKAYYTEAASELGLVETSNGLMFGTLPNTSGVPSGRLMAVIRAAESPSLASSFWQSYSPSPSRDKARLEMRKFEHIASNSTHEVIRLAKNERSAFVYPEDFPTISDYEFLLFKQIDPCKASDATLIRRGKYVYKEHGAIAGLCCKHCACQHEGDCGHHKGMWFPLNFQSLSESSFSQSIQNHIMVCPNVPQNIKDAFDELRQLASDNKVAIKRGTRKRFLEKVWQRMQDYYGKYPNPY